MPLGSTPMSWTASIATRLAALEPDSIVRLRIVGELASASAAALGAAALRRLAPPTMTVEVTPFLGGVP